MRRFALTLFAAISTGLYAQVPDSTLVDFINDAGVIVEYRRTDGIKGSPAKGLEVSTQALANFPKTLGATDPYKYIQTLAGVSTNTDNTSGLAVQGCDIGHTYTRLCDAPVFGHGHILGLFSVFNTDHFSKMVFSRNSPYGNIGGVLSLDTGNTLEKNFSGSANIGPISSHLCVNAPITGKSALSLSARRSFVDVFYKNIIALDGVSLDYRFYDVNASYFLELGKSDIIDANFYKGNDRTADISILIEGYDMNSSWGDIVGNVRWRHQSDNFNLTVNGYGSSYNSGITSKGNNSPSRLINSGITDFGMAANVQVGESWQADLYLDYYDVTPQLGRNKAVSGSLDFGWKRNLRNLSISCGLRPSYFKDFESGKDWWSVDPEVSLAYDMHRRGKLSLDLGTYHQPLFFTGPTSGGFPFEFYLTAGRLCAPQYSQSANLEYELHFAKGMYQLNVNSYFKNLGNQLEYIGSVLDMNSDSYNPENMLKPGTGKNYGVNVSLRKKSGALTGWISGSWGRSLRKTGGSEWFPSNHERICELKGFFSYKFKKWSFGSTAVFASGQSYTPPVTAYMLNGKMLIEYGKYNSCKLPPYFRLDASVSYDFRTKGRFRDGVNVSAQNLTFNPNPVMPTLKIRDGNYVFAPVLLIIRIYPSINYYCNF